MNDLNEYVKGNCELPEKPVVITFDDGYLSNYNNYYLLGQYNAKATVFTVGATMGANTYKDTGNPIYPHFDYAQAKEMYDSGTVDIQSHTYDFHRVKEWDSEYRSGASKLKGESDKKFTELFKADLEKSKAEIEQNIGNRVFALSYPEGIHSALTDVCARECGFDLTVTVDEGINTIIKGLPQSLYNLKRIGMYTNIDDKKLIELIKE